MRAEVLREQVFSGKVCKKNRIYAEKKNKTTLRNVSNFLIQCKVSLESIRDLGSADA